MAEFHRKIELQSPEDLQYLVGNVRRGAKEYLDKDFPPDLREEGDNSLHERLERNVNKYVNDTFTAAAPNITVNGLDITPTLLHSILTSDSQTAPIEREEHEPFDTKLFEHFKTLQREEEQLIEYITKARRTVPGKRVGALKEDFKGLESDEAVLKSREEEILMVAQKGGVMLNEEGREEERRNEMEMGYKGAVLAVGGLVKKLPETVAKKERAEEVESYVLGKEGKGRRGKR